MTAARLQRYALLLAGYQYDIVYRKTSDHGNADGLFRLPINSAASEADADGDGFGCCWRVRERVLSVGERVVDRAFCR